MNETTKAKLEAIKRSKEAAKKNAEKFEILAKAIQELSQKVDKLTQSTQEEEVSSSIKSLEQRIDSLQDVISSLADKEYPTTEIDLEPLIESVKAIKLKNEVNVPEPTVIQETDVLSKYKPADSKEDNNIEYRGYLAPDGKWFICRIAENKSSSTYRYAFGDLNFAKNFKNCEKLEYKYLSEAIDGLQD